MKLKTFSPELLHEMDVFWRAANYLSVSSISMIMCCLTVERMAVVSVINASA